MHSCTNIVLAVSPTCMISLLISPIRKKETKEMWGEDNLLYDNINGHKGAEEENVKAESVTTYWWQPLQLECKLQSGSSQLSWMWKKICQYKHNCYYNYENNTQTHKPPKAACDRVGWHKGAHDVGHSDCQQLLVGIDPVVVLTGWGETLS